MHTSWVFNLTIYEKKYQLLNIVFFGQIRHLSVLEVIRKYIDIISVGAHKGSVPLTLNYGPNRLNKTTKDTFATFT